MEVSPPQGGLRRLTKASLAILKACSACGDRDLNWAKWQPLAPGRALRAWSKPFLQQESEACMWA